MDSFFIGASPADLERIKKLFRDSCPVIHRGIEYSHISAIIYRRNKKGLLVVQVELMDKCKHSVTIAPIDKVNAATE